MTKLHLKAVCLTFACTALSLAHAAKAASDLDASSLARAETALDQHAATTSLSDINALLDSSFEWTNAQGLTRNKTESLAAGSAFFKDLGAKALTTNAYAYDKLGFVRGTTQNIRFLHVWERGPDGWQLLVSLDTPILPMIPRHAATPGDCDNPCRVLPYTPQTAMDQAILATWQQEKMDEWHPNPNDWARGIADEFMIISSRIAYTKLQRVAFAKKEQATGLGAPGDPIISMSIRDFGTENALMVSTHLPYRGGKPYDDVRVWIYRDGRWQLAISQQTTIQAATPLPGVASPGG